MKYTLASDRMTEIHKTVALDIPVIQPFHASFDILPLVAEEGGMQDPFAEGEFMLNVRQAWLLTSSIGRLGSEMLEVRHIGVEGNLEVEGMVLEIKEGKGCSSDEGLIGFTPLSGLGRLIVVLDTAGHAAETMLVVSRPEDSEATPLLLRLVVAWRRHGMELWHEWNTISIPIPELNFFPFAPRVLAGRDPSSNDTDTRCLPVKSLPWHPTEHHHIHT
jgi:hypothetical protein